MAAAVMRTKGARERTKPRERCGPARSPALFARPRLAAGRAVTHTRAVEAIPLRWLDPPEGPAIVLLDQTRLPAEESVVTCTDVPALVDAMRRLVVRGAPMLGVAGAFGVALAAYRGDDVAAAAAQIQAARPTAVNLGWGTRRALAAYHEAAQKNVQDNSERCPARAVVAEARSIAAQDAEASAAMARHGLALVPPQARVLTHCNTGALVSAGEGTAFAVILAAHREGRLARLWIDETRPLLQGARLTAWEARRAGMPHAVLADSAAASLLAAGEVDIVLTGADRIAADGSVANKVGTYSLAVLARHHNVPFFVVAPVSTIDMDAPDGAAIEVEQRAGEEVTSLAGVPVAPGGTAGYNPAFDVTPPDLISAIVTERGVAQPVTAGTLRVLYGQQARDEAALAPVYVERCDL
jgi:methylthioribose-1-phosphate isomerase